MPRRTDIAPTFAEAAERLGVPVEAIRELAARGEFRPVDVGARKKFINPVHLPRIAAMLGVEWKVEQT